MFKKALKNKKGFTLVELMVVVAILGVLVAVAVPVYNNMTAKAELSTIKSNLRIINSAIMQADIDGVTTPSATNLVPTYMQAWPTGPSGVESYSVGGSAADGFYAVAKIKDDASYKEGDTELKNLTVKLKGDKLVDASTTSSSGNDTES